MCVKGLVAVGEKSDESYNDSEGEEEVGHKVMVGVSRTSPMRLGPTCRGIRSD